MRRLVAPKPGAPHDGRDDLRGGDVVTHANGI